MLDKTSEKVLSYLINKYEENNQATVLLIDTSDAKRLDMSFNLFCSACDYLQSYGYISDFITYYDKVDGRLTLPYKGYTYFQHKKKIKLQYFMNLLLSKWCDIIVAFVTSVIVNINWDSIVEFVSNLMSK